MPSLRRVGWVVAGLTACTPAELTVGRHYEAMGNLPVAIEYYDVGLNAHADNQELRQAATLAVQRYERLLRQDVERLRATGRASAALGRAVLAEETVMRAQGQQLTATSPEEIKREHDALVQAAVTVLREQQDQRAQRGEVVESDLEHCRRLQALVQDEAVDAACARLLGNLKRFADVTAVSPLARELAAATSRRVTEQNPERLQLVGAESDQRDARLELDVQEPAFVDTGWTQVEREAFHGFVPRRDRNGRLVTKEITIPPSQSEIDAAKKKGKPAPQPKKVTKQVYDEVSGEYVYHGRTRTLVLPYRARLFDERSGQWVAAVAAAAKQESRSVYAVYRGDARGPEVKSAHAPLGEPSAPRLADRDAMQAAAQKEAVAAMAKGIVAAVE